MDIAIKLNAVESSNVKAIGYDAKYKLLDIMFGNEKVYRYYQVPAETHAALDKAESKGSFIAKNIKGKFECNELKRLNPTDEELKNLTTKQTKEG